MRFNVERIVLTDESEIAVKPGAISVIVGPNNGGKTLFLRELHEGIQGVVGGPHLVDKVECDRAGEYDDVAAWIREYLVAVPRPDRTDPQYTGHAGGASLESYSRAWTQGGALPNLPLVLAAVYIGDRFALLDEVESVNPMRDGLINPVQYLLADTEALSRLHAAFRRAFDTGLYLMKVGPTLVFHVGELPVGLPTNEAAPEYLAALGALPLLSGQGDGMKSFVACALYTLVERHRFIVLLDEPEMFLHPPQARLLATLMAEHTRQDRQLFLATHSGDLIRGLLDSGADRLEVIRVSRSEPHVRQLDSDDVRELWEDSILRFSNALDGLFHDEVVVCEADTDCRFYSAVLDALVSLGQLDRRPDVFFTHTGGKTRISVVARALHKIGVSTKVVADFDVLCEQRDIQRIVEAIGGDWAKLEPDWKIVKANLDQKSAPLKLKQVKSKIETLLDTATGDRFEQQLEKDIREVMRHGTMWGIAKTAGRSVVSSGGTIQALDRLLADLRNVGVFVVDCGDLETFVPSVSGHGTGWLTEVLSNFDLRSASELDRARQFVGELFRPQV